MKKCIYSLIFGVSLLAVAVQSAEFAKATSGNNGKAEAATSARALIIGNWVCWGPGWGRGGLAASAVDYEANLHPQPGDLDLSLGTDRTRLIPWIAFATENGIVDFYNDRFPTKNILDGAGRWAGGAGYACTYVHSDIRRLLGLQLTGEGATVWLNGKVITPEPESGLYPCALDKGWSRLLVKLLSPSLIRGIPIQLPADTKPSNWSFRGSLFPATDEDEMKDLRFSTRDPRRMEDDACVRFQSKLVDGSGAYPLFVQRKWNGKLTLQIKAATGAADNYQPDPTRKYVPKGGHWIYTRAPRAQEPSLDDQALRQRVATKLDLKLIDYRGNEVYSRSQSLDFDGDFTATASLRLPRKYRRMPGHYTLLTTYLDASGKVLADDNYHAFAVVSGSVDQQRDTAARKISCVGHWMANPDDFSIIQNKLQWLHTVGITWHQKMSQAWSKWGIRHDRKGNVSFTPRENITKTIELADELGITLIGDLTMGYVHSDRKRNAQLMALTAEEADAERQASRGNTKAESIRLIAAGAAPLPFYGTLEFEKTLGDYARTLVSSYPGISYWCSDNEIDLHSGKAGTPEAIVYSAAARIFHRELKMANPQAIYLSASICRNTPFIRELFDNGFGTYCDWVDVHAHPHTPPQIDAPTIGNSPREGFGSAAAHCPNPLFYGELSAPLAHSPEGVRGQADTIPKQVAWALNKDRVRLLSYLVPYSNGANLGFCNIYGEPLPAACAVNTASHLVDGKARLAPISLNSEIQQLRVENGESDILLLWSGKTTEITLPLKGKKAIVYNLLGQKRRVNGKSGSLQLTIGPEAIYLER